jgi:discoidin domain receptor family protein 2
MTIHFYLYITPIKCLCYVSDGVTSYSMRQGDRRGQEVDLYDFTYDGVVRDGYLSGGLGQLLDWEEGQLNFRLDLHGVGKKGYEWVGWKNDTMNGKPVEIRFEFDGVYNFSDIRIHTSNLFTKDIMVFSKALVYFSIGGKYYSGQPVLFEYMRDELMEFPRDVHIPIPHRLGRYVKLELFFAKRWIMISEIRFENGEYFSMTHVQYTPPITYMSLICRVLYFPAKATS